MSYLIKLSSYIVVAILAMMLGVLLGIYSAQMVINPVLKTHERILTEAVLKPSTSTSIQQNVDKIKTSSGSVGFDALIAPVQDSIVKPKWWQFRKRFKTAQDD